MAQREGDAYLIEEIERQILPMTLGVVRDHIPDHAREFLQLLVKEDIASTFTDVAASEQQAWFWTGRHVTQPGHRSGSHIHLELAKRSDAQWPMHETRLRNDHL